jgi:hypothetical protein
MKDTKADYNFSQAYDDENEQPTEKKEEDTIPTDLDAARDNLTGLFPEDDCQAVPSEVQGKDSSWADNQAESVRYDDDQEWRPSAPRTSGMSNPNKVHTRPGASGKKAKTEEAASGNSKSRGRGGKR